MRKRIESETRTVVFLDIVGYTHKTSRLSRENVSRFHETFDELVIPAITKHKGKLIKKLGDGFLITFNSATQSLLWAQEVQTLFWQYNQEKKKGRKISLKIGIHTGEVVLKEEDILGEAANIASRIQQKAKPNQILFSISTFLSMNKNEIKYVPIGLKKIRGIKHPLRLFAVKTMLKSTQSRMRRNMQRTLFFLLRVALIVVTIAAITYVVRYLLSF